jgi:hypothetical protein
MTTPIIFLDFDGPLFSTRAMLFPENKLHAKMPEHLKDVLHPFISYWRMDPIAVTMLNQAIEITNAEVVISSTWRELHTKEEILALFDVNGLKVVLHDHWCTPRNTESGSHLTKYHPHRSRFEEIQDWLNEHPEIVKWVSIDDDTSIKQFPQKHRVLVDDNNGIMYNDYIRILETLK